MKVAIVKTGFTGAVHAKALKHLSGTEVIGIQESTPEKSKRAADQLDPPIPYNDWEPLLADEEVNTFHIATDEEGHQEIALCEAMSQRGETQSWVGF